MAEQAARRHKLSEAAHGGHPIHAPLSDDSVAALIEALQVRPGDRVVDIGCGSGEWLLRIATLSGTAGLGIDSSRAALRLARSRAAAVEPRPAFQLLDAARWHPANLFDRALCVGSSHALGGLEATLRRGHELLEPSGLLLLGEGFWQTTPTPAALDALGVLSGEMPDLAGLLSRIEEHGYSVVQQVVSSPAEWDDYETQWCDGALEFAATHPSDPDAEWIRRTALSHREGYWGGYRGVLGFLTAVLVATTT